MSDRRRPSRCLVPRRWVPLALMLLAGLLAGCSPAPGASSPGEVPAARAAELLPVVLVPGWELGCTAKEHDWDLWRDAFVARGLPPEQFVVLRYDSCQSNMVTVEMIGDAVRNVLAASGAPRVHLIAHSMGAITARWCLMYGRCAGLVDQVVTVAGANHGTVWAGACLLQFWARSCPDLHPDSDLLAAVNLDETPPGVGFETWVSPCELVILPRESAFLDGAVNHDLVDECVDHSGWKRHRPTIATVADRLVPTRPTV